ncbi:type III-B CRISPR module-associated Cmr3 family protein [Comamonas nitrativorans]|uniref:Type III-B CRISPR module-associated Cmr3 family protein n=1 Tax=Comamonas nitrativorans TaxID=108437 RepID=A0ABV9GUY4_9BURK
MTTPDTTTCFITPLDVLFLRGNQSFGDPGSYGDSIMPPWPSVAAGAIRSRMLADSGIDLAAFGRGEAAHAELGTPSAPGSFVLHAFHVAQRVGGKVEILIAPPADLFITAEANTPSAQRLTPTAPAPGIATSSPLPLLPVLAQNERSKAAGGWWLTHGGWEKYLRGETPVGADMVKTSDLWGMDERVGVGLSEATRSAEDGKLFTNRAVAMQPGVGFAAAISGATLPAHGLLRLGGDGRAANIESTAVAWPEPDYEAIAAQGRCRLVLTSPGLFTQGWLPNGCAGDNRDFRFELHGVKARLVAASVARSEVVSGWDLARWQPKAAQRIAPGGSVYWLDDLQASPDALRKLAACGLWGEPCEDAARRAEGFNRFTLAVY